MNTYNGWANYPTWAVALWIDNEAGLYDESRRMAAAAVEDAPHYGRTPQGHLADQLKEWFEELSAELSPETVGSSWVADLYGWALAQVDWFEIAENYLEEVSA